jgi:hypothetical protein
LELCNKSESYPASEKLEKDLESMIRVISKIISSSKNH